MIVEGSDDVHSVVSLMRPFVDWPKEEAAWPVYIHMGNGAEDILSEGVLVAYLKGSVVRTFGVMLDSDASAQGRYVSIRNICKGIFPSLPDILPADGVVVENDDKRRFGVWIMPDNSSKGCLETFLRRLVPADSLALWNHSEASVKKAVEIGAHFTEHSWDKAYLRTWLAWQDPPDITPGIALRKKILDPHCVAATSFIEWFKKLYGLQSRTTLLMD
jgi:hypothetical protein